MEKEYISIREFAARANISKQRVYQLLEKKLKGYCKTIENRKYIDVSALEEIQKVSSLENVIQPLEKDLESPLKKNSEPTENSNFQPLEKGLENIIESLENIVQPLEKKLETPLKKGPESIEKSNFQPLERTIENIIESFNKQLEIKDKQISELTEMLKDVQSKQNELMCSLKAAQALHAGTIQEHIESSVKKRSRSDGSTRLRRVWSWLFRKRS